MNIKTEKFVFKKLEEKNLPLFFEWVQSPHIAKWWKSDVYKEFAQKYNPIKLTENYEVPFFIYADEKPIGYIQYYFAGKADDGWWVKYGEQEAGVVGMDIVIGEADYIGKGYGSLIIKKFIDKIFQETDAPKIIIDPDPKNVAAIRCYEKVGFKKVKELDAPGFFDVEPGKLLLMELEKKNLKKN